MTKQSIRWSLIALSILCAASGLLWIVIHTDSLLWDFRTYYAAGNAFLADLNPYSIQDLSFVVSEPLIFPFVYPPHTLWLYCLFAFPTYATSSIIFVALKALAFGILLFIWRKYFLRDLATPLFVLFSLFAFNAAVYRDFETGNISTFEQLGLWLAFSFLLRRRLIGFAIILLIFGSFKLAPLVFLLAPLLFEQPHRKTVVFASIGSLGVLAAGTFLLSPRLSAGFVQNLTASPGRGIVNPSLFQFLYEGRPYFERHFGLSSPEWLPFFIFLAAAVCIFVPAIRALQGLRKSTAADKELLTILFLCVVFALLLPRFKDYSYILLIVPSWFILHRSGSVRSPALSALLIMIPFHPPIAGLGIITPIWNYYPLAVSIVIFILFLLHIDSLRETRNIST